MASQPVIQLRIQLVGADPAVWRRLLVPGGAKLSRLHDIFQAAMGWTDSHLHNFTIGDQVYGPDDEDNDFDVDEEQFDETEHTVLGVLRGDVRRFVYEYDFGDSWTHEVVVEEITQSPTALKQAVCLDGEGACPPEDVGGVMGYRFFLEALADPLHKEHDSYVGWVGYEFDPAAFSVGDANAALQRVR